MTEGKRTDEACALRPSASPSRAEQTNHAQTAQKGRCTVPSHLSRGSALVLIGVLLSATPAELTAKPHGAGAYAHPRAYGGRYVAPYRYGGGYPAYYGGRYGAYPRYGYGGYYPRYYGYGGYYGHHHHNNNAWIAVGAGALGVMLGALLARPRVYPYPYQPYAQQPYVQQQPYVEQAPAQQAPAMQQCPDGSTIPAGNYCPEPRRPRG